MNQVFFTADLHFGHENVIKFDNRPFESVKETDTELMRRWNNKVEKKRPCICAWRYDLENKK